MNYPGAVSAQEWEQHAGKGCVTWSAGTAPFTTPFLEEFPAAAYAQSTGQDLHIWHGREGHQIIPPARITFPELGEREIEID